MGEVKKLRRELKCILNNGCKIDVQKELQIFIERVKKARDEARNDFLNTKKLYGKNPSPEQQAELQQKQTKSAEIRQFHQEIKVFISFIQE